MAVLFTPAVLEQAAEIMRKHHRAIAAAIYGKDSVLEEDWDLAVKLGLVDPSADAETINEQLYTFGMVLAHTDHAARQSRYGWTASQWLEEIARNPVPMTSTEERSAKYAKAKAARFVVGLGNRVNAKLGTVMIEADAKLDRELRTTIRDVIAARYGDDAAAKRMKKRGVDLDLGDEFFEQSFRTTINRVRSDLGHATKDWARDLHRIAQTEAVEAFHRGQVDEWTEEEREQAISSERAPKQIYAYRVPQPNACRYCRQLYTEGGYPKIFTLSDLQGNGNNYGKKRAAWRPIVGATHPWCACDLLRLPKYVELPASWRSGQPAPSVIGSDGMLVLPGSP